MNDRYVEKSFLYLLVFSLLLHIGVGIFFWYMPEKKTPPPEEPVFVDLQQMPEQMPKIEPRQQETPRKSDRTVRVPRETAPRGDSPRDSQKTTPSRQPPAQPQPKSQETPQGPAPDTARPEMPLPSEQRETQVSPGSSASSLLKPKSQGDKQQSQAKKQRLFPSASRLAKLEENYRKKFEKDIAEGDTRFLNSDDIQFGSFLRRFENAIYGVWRYPQEAAMKGIEGVTPVRITFNRRGEVSHVQLLESSGARILDDEVIRTLRSVGPVGSFPKGYDRDEFHLIAFFQYGGARRALR